MPIAALLLAAGACHRGVVVQSGGAAAPVSGQSAWKSLSSASEWRGYKTDAIPAAWTFADGVLSKTRPVADIVSKDEYGNFQLELEWKIGEAGNSGIFYRGTEEYDHIYWSGPEYQLLDNIKAEDNKTPLTRAGADYGLYPAPDGHVKPVGEWNATRIVVNGNHVEHWLNGFKLVEYELGSADWKAKVAASKFGRWPNYGMAKRGHIALQGDHNGVLAFRNIRVRELP
jgi:3-keto-disaccharide hydrolase